MKMYAVKNDKGEYAHIDMDDLTWETDFATLWFGINEPYAKRTADDYGGHVVELTEAPAKVVVSEDEAEMLERLKSRNEYPAELIHRYVYGSHNFSEWDYDREIRLMRAYVNGWTVDKPNRYVLPMDGTKLADGTIAYATLDHTGVWTIKAYSKKQSAVAFHDTVTQAEIDSAPDWVKAITPVEVADDEQ